MDIRIQDTGTSSHWNWNWTGLLSHWFEPLRSLRCLSGLYTAYIISHHPLVRPATTGIGIGFWEPQQRLPSKSRAPDSDPVRRTRHNIALPSSPRTTRLQLTADPYGLPVCTPAGLLILWHHYRRPRSRKRPTVASKQLQDLTYSPHPGTSGHTSSRSRVSPAESLASLLRSPSSGQQPRLRCQRLQGMPLIWHISQIPDIPRTQKRYGTK